MFWKILTKCLLGLLKTTPTRNDEMPTFSKQSEMVVVGGGLLRKNASGNVNDFDTKNYQKSLQHKQKQCSSFLVLAKL